jgi:hypothetical protein
MLSNMLIFFNVELVVNQDSIVRRTNVIFHMIDIMMKWQAKVQKGKATRPCANMWHTCIYRVLLKQMDRKSSYISIPIMFYKECLILI